MTVNKQRIMTVNAKTLFKYYPIGKDDEKTPFCFDTRKRTFHTLVVKQEVEMNECPLFHQIIEVLLANKVVEETDVQKSKDLLYNQFLIMDFEDVFMPIDENASDAIRKWREGMRNNARNLIENGLDILFENEEIHMVPFDKSGNMSRNGRISFVNAKYVKELNERLNLGIDFGKIPVCLSKYYAYRGLYLSTSQRVNHEKFKITPETLIIVRDNRKSSGSSFERNVKVLTAEQGKIRNDWEFQEPKEQEILPAEKPYDGEGFITPEYSSYINEALGINGANSFQIRLPFAKGMLHEVDVLEFIKEYTKEGKGDKQYLYVDAFGKERDLRKAHIFMTESMFKGKKWLDKYCDVFAVDDPMKFYCDAIDDYKHGFYISGTNLPYGHSKYTHLSYQTLNTLAFDDNQFKRIMDGHYKFIENPIEFIKNWDEIEHEDIVKEECDERYQLSNWKRAVLQNPSLADDKYIKEQLENIQKSLLSKIALGKVLVEGQTRYLCRDLAPLLSSLLRDDTDVRGAYLRSLYSRFYLPRGKNNKIKLNHEEYYAFLRNPHLSRNEQYIMRPFVLPKSEKDYIKDGRKSYEKYEKYVNMYDKYFSHLTGIVMVPRGSTLPLCLGGADFDGDLVSVIINNDVVDAIANGVYNKSNPFEGTYYYRRKLPAIKIPSTEGDEVLVPEHVPYQHIEDTFSNHIGRISNAAISIGQVEYDRNNSVESEFDANVPTCDMCTLFTGLEIDAAKNGVHPNLDLILNMNIAKSAYLDFIKQFKELKAEKYFHYENMEIADKTKEVSGVDIKYIEIGAKGCKTKVIWDPALESTGTYINLLPKYFLDYLDEYLKKKKVATKFIVKQEGELSKNEKELIKEFKNSCDEIIRLYLFYKNKFLKRLTKEKNNGYYAVENAEAIIMHMYDETCVDNKLFETLPSLREKIVKVLSIESTVQDIRDRINAEQWLLQPSNRRDQVLETIIGNGFKVTDLTEEERELICHFNQQGYKMLWRILDLIEGPKMLTYEELCEEMKEERAALSIEESGVLETLLKEELQRYYEKNAANIEQVLYAYCIGVLRNVIDNNLSLVDHISRLVVALHEKTRSQTNKSKFFWDVFTWEELQCIIEPKGENDDAK